MKSILAAACICWTLATAAQSGSAKDKILNLLENQTRSWNKGDLEGFMSGYWHSDSLMFIGKSGVNYGWENTLKNYRKGYPDTTAMGKLHFEILSVQQLSPDYCFVVGKWFLERSIGNLNGHFTLLFRMIRNEWKIIADHSS